MEQKESLRIVFMGTPDFAVESLNALVENQYNIVAVITMPDKPAGRGYQLQQSAVKKYALEHNLPILQPEKLSDETFLEKLKELKADIQIVVAFRMLPECVWNMPRLGTINLHGSLLPQYRGAAPINWAIINGEKTTGVTTFFITKDIDTGKIIFREGSTIGDEENAEDIHDHLMRIGASLLIKTMDTICTGNYITTEQSEYIINPDDLKPAPKLFKEMGHINWNSKRENIYNLIRGLSPYPAAWSEIQTGNGKVIPIKIFKATRKAGYTDLEAGTIISDGKTFLDVVAADGYVSILSLQLAGKKQMSVEDFLRGFDITDASMLSKK